MKDYFLFLGKSYGMPLSREEWDSIHGVEHSSYKIIKALELKKWNDFNRACGHDVADFSREDMLRYGQTLGINIDGVTPEQWDLIIGAGQFRKERMPASSDILAGFGRWEKFQRAVNVKLVKKLSKESENIRKQFLTGGSLTTIAERTGIAKSKIEKKLEDAGAFTKEGIQKYFPSLEEITKRQIRNIKFYNGKEKEFVREVMLDSLGSLENQDSIKYCGLPGVNFIDYVLFASKFNVAPEQSLAAELDFLSGNIMLSIIRNWDSIKGGEIFRRLKIYLGGIEDALKENRYKKMKFNLINFDWVGGWAKDKYSALKNLFEHGHLDDEAVIFLSLNDSRLERQRAVKGRGYVLNHENGEMHIQIARDCLEHLAKKSKREVNELFTYPYKDTVEMISAGYLVKRK